MAIPACFHSPNQLMPVPQQHRQILYALSLAPLLLFIHPPLLVRLRILAHQRLLRFRVQVRFRHGAAHGTGNFGLQRIVVVEVSEQDLRGLGRGSVAGLRGGGEVGPLREARVAHAVVARGFYGVEEEEVADGAEVVVCDLRCLLFLIVSLAVVRLLVFALVGHGCVLSDLGYLQCT